jgi:hypothetical protein
MIFEHYRELVTPKQAAAWFAITPESVLAYKTKLERIPSHCNKPRQSPPLKPFSPAQLLAM